ncbi:MAG: ABC transporter ATP-binding protein [Ignavibacteriaceae bacterium]|jgi:ABC-2 type transport system ATP-binding protein|nr:ABC transporter ATP-binding protein [Ignavibacteriaceae bacterium]
MKIIEIENLSKTFSTTFGKKTVTALNDVTLSVEQGTIFGLLGQNGAGKTTLIKVLLGIVYPTAGTCRMFGEDFTNLHLKKRIGFLPENHKFPNYMTGKEVLTFFGKLSGLENLYLAKRIDEMLELVQMTKWSKSKIKTYSKGMMQRLGLAQAMLNNPDLLFLDEPTDGVDPIGRKEIRNVLLALKENGKTIFLNSHLLSEVELITDRVAILHKGKIIREGNVHELTKKKEEYKIVVDAELENILEGSIKEKYALQKISSSNYLIRIDENKTMNDFVDHLRSKGVSIKEMAQEKNSLEDVFISLVQAEEKNS